MKRIRHIVCSERATLLGQYSHESLWILPREMDWTSNRKSFDLLGTTQSLDCLTQQGRSQKIPGDSAQPTLWRDSRNETLGVARFDEVDDHSQSRTNVPSADDGAKSKFVQLLYVMWLVFDYRPMTIDHGIVWLGRKIVNRLAILAEVFELLERKQDFPLSSKVLWTHCLRTGYLAGLLAREESGEYGVMSESCQAGLVHDIGLAILALSHDSGQYLDVLAYARQRSVSLAAAELLNLGISHEIVGAEFLLRQKFSQAIVDAVSFHDNPLGLETSGFTPTLAVYAANILEGGGWPQDSDGVPSDHAKEYLAGHSLIDSWPKWQRYVVQLRNLEFGRA